MIEEVKKATKIILEGGVILYPTDTIWGIGCDATNPAAVERVYQIKHRADHKAMLVLLDDVNKLPFYVEEVPEIAYDLIHVADKPMTIIYPNACSIAPNLLAEDRSLGIRITQEAFSKQLCALTKKPIVSTSANISGQTSPRIFDEICEEIKNNVDYVVNYRRNDRQASKPSSILKLGVKGEIEIIRK